MPQLPSGNAICYSGYRRGQSPVERIYPSTDEIREDLLILSRHWRLLRLYDGGSHGRGIEPANASAEPRHRHCTERLEWTRVEGILTFIFEAFDEPWKGSPDAREPEKHRGLFTVDRRPKRLMQSWYPELMSRQPLAPSRRPVPGRGSCRSAANLATLPN